MTKTRNSRLLLTAVLFIALLTMALTLGISANAEEEVLGTGLIVTATNSGETLIYGEDYTYPANTGLTILSDKAVTIANTDPSTPTTDRIEVAYGVSANITLAGVNIDLSTLNETAAAFKIADNSTGNVTITLADGTTNTLKSEDLCAGLQKNGAYISETQGKLTITGTGSLTATGGNYSGAGIGGGYLGGGSNITISGGTVTATGGEGGAGIGGGDMGDGGSNITISGGTVTAQGGDYGAGIGSGGDSFRSSSNITISGGTVTAQGGDYGAGIGGGWLCSGSDIKISGGTVTATGGDYGAGIGGGYGGGADNITISGGSVKAVAGEGFEDEGTTYFPAAIGQGVPYDGVYSNGAEVTPTDGTANATPVYPLELDVDGTSAVTINGKAYPTKHIDENKLYVYLPAGNYTVANGNSQKLYTIADDGTVSEVDTAFTITGTDLVYGVDYTYPASTGVLTILSDKDITIKNTNPSTSTTNRIEVADGVSANITLAGVNIDVFEQDYTAAFQIAENSTGNVTITLADGTTNTLKSGGGCAGLQKNGAYSEELGTLTITGTGSLIAQGSTNGAGIGGGSTCDGCNITISGGTVTATGGLGGAGIGGGIKGSAENIVISGGSVKAVAGGQVSGSPADIGEGVQEVDFVIYDGAAVIPTDAEGNNVYRCVIENLDGTDIVIDGVDYPDKHGSEKVVLAYLTDAIHTVCFGDVSRMYEYVDGEFCEVTEGTNFVVTATNSGETLVHGVDYTYSSATGILTVLSEKAITIANADGVEETDDRIIVEKNTDANITLAGVNINTSSGAAFAIADNSTGDVTLTLADGSVNTLKGADYYAGLQKNGADESVGMLTIRGTGYLTAQGGSNGAGIGGGNSSSANITITDNVVVTATGGTYGAGIGGGNRCSTGNITISGGVVITATGGDTAAGIGGGYMGSAENITITDNAVVTATSGDGGAGIGGGKGCSATDIKITDKAVVTASGKDGGAGIGGGVGGTLEDIIINGGSVNAIGSYYYEETVGGADGANIGGGVILPPDPYSEPEEGAPVTPTLADGTTPVYLLELDNPNGADISIDGVDYPDKHGDEKKIYAYVTGKNHIVKFNDTLNLYVFSDGSFDFISELKTPTLNIFTTSDNFVGLSWNDLGDTVSYEVYRSATGSDFVKIATADGTAYTDTTVVAGNRYYYQIRAYYSEYDVYVVSDIGIVTVLDAPVITKVTYGDGTVTLTWNKVTGADHYSVHLIDSPAFDGLTDAGNTAETTITLNDLPEGKYLIVCALDTETFSTSGFSVSVPTTIPVPENISTEASDKQVTLTWDAVEGATKYAVYFGTDAENLKLVSDTVTDTTFTVTELVFNTEYYFAVKAYIPDKWSELSDTVSVTTEACKHGDKATAWSSDENNHWQECIDCGADLNKAAHSGTYICSVCGFEIFVDKADIISVTPDDASATVKWNAVEGASKYRVFYYLNGSYKTVGDTTATSYKVTGLSNNVKYGFLVRAYVNGVWTMYSTADNVYATPFEKPVVTAYAGNTTIKLTWDKIDGATKYIVYSFANNKYTTYKTVTTNYCDVTGLTNGTKYTYLVRAYVNGAWTPYSAADQVSATPVAKPVVKAYAGNTAIKLTWDKIDGATKYIVYSFANNKYTTYKTVTTNYCDVTGLTNGTKYTYLVRAYVNGAWTPYSAADQVSATPVAKPVVKAYAGNTTIKLTWDKIDGATKYAVYSYANGKYTTYKTVTTNYCDVTGLTNDTKYTYLVRAYVNGAWTPYSAADQVSATPVAKPVVKAYAGNTTIKLTWDKIDGATKYIVYSFANNKYTTYKTVTTNYCDVTGLTNGTKYTYLVRAYVNGAWTAYNAYDQVSATPVAKPVISSATAGNGSVALSWSAVNGATKYAVYTYSTGKYTFYKNLTGTSVTVSGLTNGTKYGFVVRAYVNDAWTPYNTYDIAYATPKS